MEQTKVHIFPIENLLFLWCLDRSCLFICSLWAGILFSLFLQTYDLNYSNTWAPFDSNNTCFVEENELSSNFSSDCCLNFPLSSPRAFFFLENCFSIRFLTSSDSNWWMISSVSTLSPRPPPPLFPPLFISNYQLVRLPMTLLCYILNLMTDLITTTYYTVKFLLPNIFRKYKFNYYLLKVRSSTKGESWTSYTRTSEFSVKW